MNMYERTDEHKANNERFRQFVADYPYLTFFQPSPDKAPWHWQVKVRQNQYEILVNFWPHVAKMQPENELTVKGWEKISHVFDAVLLDGDENQVIE